MIRATKVYKRINQKLKKGIRIFVLRGGSRSSKTYSVMQFLFIWLLTGWLGEYKYYESGKCDIVRKYGATLAVTARLDFENIYADFLGNDDIDEQIRKNVQDNITINKQERIIKFGRRAIFFIGADSWWKLKGGSRDILFCNEASELQFKLEFNELMMRTKDIAFLDFNPNTEDIRINGEIEQKRFVQKKDVAIDISTYKDNAFLTTEQKEEIEYLQQVDEQLWKVYGLGEYGKLVGQIFNYNIAEIPEKAKLLGRGLDFGFSNHPSALTDVRIDDKDIYLDELIYSTGLTNDDLSEKMSALGLQTDVEIFADSAEPKSIEEIYRKGWNVKPAGKGKDSISYGIDLMKGYKLHITPTSTHIVSEFKTYVRLTDKNGKSLNKPIDKNNHCFHKDTLIQTQSGIKKICDIKKGEYVLTSGGYNKVLSSGVSGYDEILYFLLQLDTFSVKIMCTKDHLFFTDNGWKQIGQIKKGETIYLHKHFFEKLIQNMNEKDIIVGDVIDCMSLFGNIQTEKLHTDIKSTISMETQTITNQAISRSLKKQNTKENIEKLNAERIRNGLKNFTRKVSRWLRDGTNQKNDTTDINNTISKHDESEQQKKKNVLFAEKNIGQSVENSVEIIANQNIEDGTEQITKQEFVLDAEKTSKQISIAKENIVVGFVLQSIDSESRGKDYVYDLTMENDRNFFANGVLVHNCIDGIRYCIMEKLGVDHKEVNVYFV